MKSLSLLLASSLFALLVAFMVPTSVEGGNYLRIDNPVIYFVIINFNRLIFSLVMANIGLIACRFSKKYVYVVIVSVFTVIFLTFGLTAAGGAIENIVSTDFNMDWLNIYAPLQIESGGNYLFQVTYVMTLFIITLIVLVLGYQGSKNFEE